MTVQFIRSTHENGRWRAFPPKAHLFWQQHGTVIGSLLQPEEPLSFAELNTACAEYALEYVADGPQPEQNRGYVAWVLVHLLQFGMVTAVPVHRPASPAALDWLSVFPPMAEVG